MSPDALRSARRPMMRALTPALTAAAVLLSPSAAAARDAPSVDGRERGVVHRVNAVRAQHGLPPLAIGRRLSRAAYRHSQRMAAARTLTHRTWGEAGLSARLRWATGPAKVGETIYWGSGAVRSARIVRAWMDSPGHRAMILSTGFRTVGVGVRAGRGGQYVTLDFSS
ncbi:MAG: CAP domain-containing protein [Patulibacter minatonensis]